MCVVEKFLNVLFLLLDLVNLLWIMHSNMLTEIFKYSLRATEVCFYFLCGSEWWRTADTHSRPGAAAFFPPLLGIPTLFAPPAQNHDSASFHSRATGKSSRSNTEKGNDWSCLEIIILNFCTCRKMWNSSFTFVILPIPQRFYKGWYIPSMCSAFKSCVFCIV